MIEWFRPSLQWRATALRKQKKIVWEVHVSHPTHIGQDVGLDVAL
jgi:hypothetical protein